MRVPFVRLQKKSRTSHNELPPQLASWQQGFEAVALLKAVILWIFKHKWIFRHKWNQSPVTCCFQLLLFYLDTPGFTFLLCLFACHKMPMFSFPPLRIIILPLNLFINKIQGFCWRPRELVFIPEMYRNAGQDHSSLKRTSISILQQAGSAHCHSRE